MDANTVGILQELANLPWLHVAFLIDVNGRLLGSVGESAAFSHSGQIREFPPEPIENPDTSLYVTAVADGVYLGVLYSAEVEIEEVRAEVRHCEQPLAEALRA